jgi:hypothetical protein
MRPRPGCSPQAISPSGRLPNRTFSPISKNEIGLTVRRRRARFEACPFTHTGRAGTCFAMTGDLLRIRAL